MTTETQSCDSRDIPFSLVCRQCDSGLEIASHEQAMAAGWSEIDYAPNLPMVNFIGVCPDCLESFERWPVADDRIE